MRIPEYGNANEFFLDPMGTIGNAYQSIEMTALTAKYLINQYYGTGPTRSYWVGCSDRRPARDGDVAELPVNTSMAS